MRELLLLTSIVFASASCKSIECGPGTIQRGETCAPADETTGVAACGPFTELVGDQCVPMFPPTVCDPSTTSPDTDPTTGVTTCIGTGGGGCSAAFACPTPAAGTQTICGQLYDLKDNSKFAAPNATGEQCTTATASGPCALQINAFDAIAFGSDPANTPPLPSGTVYIDDCGRYRVPDIMVPSSSVIALGIDDAGMAPGPTGVTNTTGVATFAVANTVIKNFEAWVVSEATTDLWTASGGPPLSGGIFVGIFRTHACNPLTGVCTGDAFATSSGVTITKSNAAETLDDFYFTAETTHVDIDPVATATSINGTGLLTNASVADLLVYSGTGGIADTTDCTWETHAAVSLPYIVFLQIFRPTNAGSNTCTQ